MIEKVFRYIQKYQMIKEGDTIVAGISGGADSVCLLFVLTEIRKRIPFHLAVVHVNHGIRMEAKEDAEYVRLLCAKQKIPFYLKEADVKVYAKEQGISEEEAGRIIRYRAFEEVLLKERDNEGGKIAVAHNSNDCAETMLFNLFRGTGLKGLIGIKPVNGNIIRPILCLERKEIEEYLANRKLKYCHDYTNDGDGYTRNKIRHHILPYAEEEVCSHVVEHMTLTATHLDGAQEYIQKQTYLARKRCCEDVGEIAIRITDFMKEDEYLQGQILLSLLEEISPGRKDITAAHISQIKDLIHKDGSKEIDLPYGIKVCKVYDVVTIKREPLKKNGVPDETKIVQEYVLEGHGKLSVPGLGIVEFTVFPYNKNENIPQKTYTKWFDYGKIKQSVLLRKRQQGDYLTINNQMSKKSLQDYLVNEKVPKADRNYIYVLADASHIMWVPGHRISEYYKVTENTERVLQVKIVQNLTQEERSHENG